MIYHILMLPLYTLAVLIWITVLTVGYEILRDTWRTK